MHHVEPTWPPRTYSKKEYQHMMGRFPTHEEWENMNCTQMGRPGHLFCGVCPYHQLPRAECGCPWPYGTGHNPPAMRIRIRDRSIAIDIERIDGLPVLTEIAQVIAAMCNAPITPQLERQIESQLHSVFTRLMAEGRIRRRFPDNHLKYFPIREERR